MIQTTDWLPIGSVAHVRGRDGLLMVIACMAQDELTGELWDYAAVPYPLGLVGPERDVMFDKESIDGVFALGFQNEDSERLQELYQQAQGEFLSDKQVSRSHA